MASQNVLPSRDWKEERDFKDLHLDLAFRIVADESDYLVVDKPAPLPVHPVSRFRDVNLLRLLEQKTRLALHVVNRLDSETSGLILFAKSPAAARALGDLFSGRKVEKVYESIVCGYVASKEGRIELRLGGEKTRYCFRSFPDERGKRAITRYRVMNASKQFSHLKLFPETGRTHQLRAHLSAWGHPIAGDKIYIDRRIFETYVHTGWTGDMEKTVFLPRLALHASEISFVDPFSFKKKQYRTKLPALLDDFLKNHF